MVDMTYKDRFLANRFPAMSDCNLQYLDGSIAENLAVALELISYCRADLSLRKAVQSYHTVDALSDLARSTAYGRQEMARSML